MVLEIIGTTMLVVIGLLIVYSFMWLFSIFDAIRDRNLLGVIILIIFPFLGLIIYLLFLNKPSGKRASVQKKYEILKTRKKVSYNPFKMPLSYLFAILTPIIIGLTTKVPVYCSYDINAPGCEMIYILLLSIPIGFIVGWVINSVFRAIRN